MTDNRVTREQKRPDFGAMLAKYGKAEATRDRKAFSIGAELAGLWSAQESERRELYAENARLQDALRLMVVERDSGMSGAICSHGHDDRSPAVGEFCWCVTDMARALLARLSPSERPAPENNR